MFKKVPMNTKIIATIPVLASVALVSLLARSYGLTDYYSAFVLGIIAGGLVDLDNGLTGRLKNIGITLFCFTLSSLSVQLTVEIPLLFILTMTTLAFCVTLMGAAGVRYRTIAFGTVAVAVYTGLADMPDSSWILTTVGILFGTLLYSALALLTHLIFPHRPVQENMATAYDALGHFLDEKATFFDPDEAEYLDEKQVGLALGNTKVINGFNACRSTLFYRMRGQHRHPRTAKMLRYYLVAQDIHERISSSHVHYQAFAEKMQHSDLIFRIRRLLELQSDACHHFAKVLREGKDNYCCPAKLVRASKGVERSLKRYLASGIDESESISIKRLTDNILSVSRQLASLGNPDGEAEYTASAEQSRIIGLELGGVGGALREIRSRLTFESSVFRHSVRLAVVVAAGSVLAFTVGKDVSDGLPAFWILLTAIFVCQPNYSATKPRLVQRIIGTIGGVFGGFLLTYFPLSLDMKFAVVAVATTLFFFFRSNKYSFSTFFITVQALMSLSVMGYDMNTLFLPRVLDTVIGTLLAGVAVYYLWPDWQYSELGKNASKAIRSQGGYLRAILQDLHDKTEVDGPDYRLARRRSHENAAALSSTVSDMSSEPKKYAADLGDGLMLLKINYSLISCISALGAYRQHMHNNEEDALFLSRFFPIAQSSATLLENINGLKNDDFQAALTKIKTELNEIEPEYSGDGQSNILWQQLLMISELLPRAYRTLNRGQGS